MKVKEESFCREDGEVMLFMLPADDARSMGRHCGETETALSISHLCLRIQYGHVCQSTEPGIPTATSSVYPNSARPHAKGTASGPQSYHKAHVS